MPHNNGQGTYIRYLILVVFLLIPFKVIAENHIDENATQTQNYSIEREAFMEAQAVLSQELTAKAETLKGSWQGQCVIAVRNFLGVGRDQIAGMAKNTQINSNEPEVGSIIILNMSNLGHVGVVLFTTDDGMVVYYDSNGDWKQRANIRQISITDKRIKGYHKITN